MNKPNIKKLISLWPKWMQNYRLTPNSPQKNNRHEKVSTNKGNIKDE